MTISWRIWAAIGVVLAVLTAIIALFIADAQSTKTPAPLPLVNTFDDSPTGFSFMYPEDWEYMIPLLGVLVTGPSQTLYGNQPGPTFTVQRIEPISIWGTLENALDSYLQSGPLRNPDRWTIVAPVSITTLEDRDARIVELEGSDSASSAPIHTRIIATLADNTFVYIFITSVPVDHQNLYASTLQAMLDSVRILE